MNWSTKRQFFYLFILLLFLLFLLIWIFWPLLNKKPTCFDGKRNGKETGVDCGGDCQLLCREQMKKISIKWARPFKVIDGRYNVAAYIENQNVDAGVKEISYIFKVFDKDNRFIVERVGKTYIAPSASMIIFESGLMTGGNRIPAFVRFQFLEEPTWYRIPPFIKNISLIINETPNFIDQETTPKLTVNIFNQSFFITKDVDVYAVLYDEEGNALAVSKTVISEINRNSFSEAFFSWFLPIEGFIAKKEVIATFNPFSEFRQQ